MTLLDALILGIIQGITEFLPISSSGHLVLTEHLLHLEVSQLKGFDVVLHAGTLVAIFAYFWKDIWAAARNLKMIGYILLATIPAGVLGLTLEDWLDEVFRDPSMIFGVMILLALYFVIAEKFPPQKNKTQFTWRNTFVMGLAQAVALIPGVSRSGSTISAGLLFGLKREEAAKFSFILGIPAIAGATLLTGIKVVQGEAPMPETSMVIMGFLVSAVVGYVSVSFLMKFLKKNSLHVFAIYLVVVGVLGLLSTYSF